MIIRLHRLGPALFLTSFLALLACDEDEAANATTAGQGGSAAHAGSGQGSSLPWGDAGIAPVTTGGNASNGKGGAAGSIGSPCGVGGGSGSGPAVVCGDGYCQCGETCSGCPQDCGTCPVCGNGIVEAGEECDGGVAAGLTCSVVFGAIYKGEVSCNSKCRLDAAGCTKLCGNGVRDPGEACEGQDIGTATCASALGASSTGSIACSSACQLDTSGCSSPAPCGSSPLGLRANAPWPSVRRCPGRQSQGGATGPATPALRWRFSTGGRHLNGVAIDASGTIYAAVAAYYGEQESLIAIGADGSPRWWVHAPRAMSPLIGKDGVVYIGGDTIRAYLPDGTLRWEGGTTPQNGGGGGAAGATGAKDISTRPVSIEADGTLISLRAEAPFYETKFAAHDPTGKLLWLAATHGAHMNGPEPPLRADGSIVVTHSAYGSVSVIAPDGTLTAKVYLAGQGVGGGSGGGYSPQGVTVGADGTIYIASYPQTPGTLFALGPSLDLLWQVDGGLAAPQIGAGGTIYVSGYDQTKTFGHDGAQLWSAPQGRPGAIVDAAGNLYTGASSLGADGTLRWSLPEPHKNCRPLAMAADGAILYLTPDNSLLLVGESP